MRPDSLRVCPCGKHLNDPPRPHRELMWPRLFRRFEGGARTLQGQLRDMLVHARDGGLPLARRGPAVEPAARADRSSLSRTTVTLALQALADKGLIVSRARSGYFVSEQLPATYLGARQRAECAAPRRRAACAGPSA